VKRIGACLLVLAACSESDNTFRASIETGRLENAAIGEASGLARSITRDNQLWVINDGGSPATLYAIGFDGSDRGEVAFTGLRNIDWEDLASFESEGRPMLLIADVGDNLGMRDHVMLYVVGEPAPEQHTGRLLWTISLRFPDGPRDVEAVAVDPQEGLAYLLSKRTIPAELYSVPLFPIDNEPTGIVTATYLGTVASIPQPAQSDRNQALFRQDWHWQPTAMEFSADGKLAVVLTYRAAYLYSRHEGQSWVAALQQSPRVFALAGIREAEAATLASASIFVTVEAAHAPLYRIFIRP